MVWLRGGWIWGLWRLNVRATKWSLRQRHQHGTIETFYHDFSHDQVSCSCSVFFAPRIAVPLLLLEGKQLHAPLQSAMLPCGPFASIEDAIRACLSELF